MSAFLKDYLRVARWRIGVCGHAQLIKSSNGLCWSSDGESWSHVPVDGKFQLSTERYGVRYEQELASEIVNLASSHGREPMAHELLREAQHLKATSPRSSLVLAVSALEVGTKAFIAKRVPDAEWLAFEAPTPPVLRLLTEYVPRLTADFATGKFVLPNQIKETVKRAVSQRNAVMHQGVVVDNDSSLDSKFDAIRSTLYLLDYYSGCSWALNHVRDTELDEMRALVDNAKRKWPGK